MMRFLSGGRDPRLFQHLQDSNKNYEGPLVTLVFMRASLLHRDHGITHYLSFFTFQFLSPKYVNPPNPKQQ